MFDYDDGYYIITTKNDDLYFYYKLVIRSDMGISKSSILHLFEEFMDTYAMVDANYYAELISEKNVTRLNDKYFEIMV
jgi:hypothetical protein